MKHLSINKKVWSICAMPVFVLLMLFIFAGCSNNDITSNDNLDSSIPEENIDWDFFNDRAVTFITATANGDFDVAVEMFDETMAGLVDADVLQDFWEDIIAIAGEFISIHEIQNAAVDEFYIAGVIMRHENIGFGWNVVFSEDGLVAGLNTGGTIPLPDAMEQESPTITARDGFTDYPIVIGENTNFPLSGILSIPDSEADSVSGVVIVQGSGPSDMDGNVFGNKPYRDIAEFLAQNGVAVIRHDKRTFAHSDRFVQEFGGNATVWEESIEDAILAAELLRADSRIDENRVFIIGHSLGGILAPRIHANGGDFAGMILMAATPRSMLELYIEQNAASIHSGYEEGLIDSAAMEDMLAGLDLLAELFDTIANMTIEEAITTQIPAMGVWAYYFKDMEAHSFTDYAKAATIPILVMQGGSDFQVLADVDFILLQELFAQHDNVTFKLYEGLNHLFMPTTATNFVQHANEMIQTPGYMDTRVLYDILNWILSQ